MLGLRHSGELCPSTGRTRKERARKDANNLIITAIAAAETESNYCLVLSAKDSSRRCRNRLSYSIAANADRAGVSSSLYSTLAAQVRKTRLESWEEPQVSCALETGSARSLGLPWEV